MEDLETVTWDGVRQAIGLPDARLPWTGACPACKRDGLTIYTDHTTSRNGAWYHCRNCNRCGGLLGLAALMWDCGLNDAAAKLGVPVQPSHSALNQLWVDSSRQLKATAGKMLQPLLGRHGALPPQTSHLLHRLLGVASSNDLATAFGPKPVGLTHRRWQDTAVCPFFDLPGRVCGVQLASADSHVETFRGKPGLTALPSGLLPSKILALPNWWAMLAIQMRHLRSSLTLFPVVAWPGTVPGAMKPMTAWSAFKGCSVIIWCQDLDPGVVAQAIAADASILIGNAGHGQLNHDCWSPQSLRGRFERDPGYRLLASLARRARHWPVALRDYLRSRNKPATQDMINRLEHNGVDVSYVLRQMGTANVPTAIRGARPNRVKPERLIVGVPVNGFNLRQARDTWTANDAPGNRVREISNATFQISHLITDEGLLYYRGIIRHRGKSARFLVLAAELEADPAGWLQKAMAARKLGALSIAPRWKPHLLQVAMAFHPPRVDSSPVWQHIQMIRHEDRRVGRANIDGDSPQFIAKELNEPKPDQGPLGGPA